LSHKFLGPYAGPFKGLEKKFPDTYKLKLSKNLKVHPIFHVLFFKLVAHDAFRPNQKHNSRPPPNLIDNESKFEVEAMLKSKQLKGQKTKILSQVERIPTIEASWVNEFVMEHAQEAIEEFHNRLAKKQTKHRM
jgi:hypothetical protein